MKLGRYIGAGVLAVAILGGFAAFNAMPASAQVLSPEERARLQAEYDQLQQEIAQWQKVLDETKAKKNTLQGDVSALTAQINKAQAEIRQRNLSINSLQGQITQKTATVQTLEEKLAAGQASLAKLLREKNERESTPLAVLALSSGSLSDFFGAVSDIDAVDEALQDHFDELRGVKKQTEEEKAALAAQKDAQLNAKYEVEVKAKQIDAAKQEKNNLLKITTQEESAYQKVLSERQARAASIRNALFNLRDTSAITFETALAYATEAERVTGVRAAFILGVLRQESNLGANVGQCYLVNATTGAGKSKRTGAALSKVMHPTRDVPPFLDITSRLGIDPYNQVVSCPQSIGYGGAMGPSQFIPSTWKSYEKRVASAMGVATADPWNAKHAITATAYYMKDLGAAAQTYAAERKAAAQYYAGGSWATLGLSYAASVLAHAEQYQENIDFLKENNL